MLKKAACALLGAALFCCACAAPAQDVSAATAEVPLPAGVVERDMVINAGKYSLAAKLTLPEGGENLPGVVIVHGSGPMDMDGTTAGVKPYRDLAYGLAARGIAVLRYDKRTYAYQAQLDPETLTLFDETVADACEACALLCSLPEIDTGRILLLGHSLGGMLLPLIDGYLPEVRGNILMAAPAQGLNTLIARQYEYLLEQGYADPGLREELMRQVRNVETLTKNSALTAGELLGAPRDYWLELRDYDAPAALRDTGLPVLLLQGERDYQVPPDQWERYREALTPARATALSYPGLNHLFCAGEGASTPREYEAPARVEEAVVEDIAQWIMGLE